MPSPMMNATYFIVNTLFDIYIFILMLRVILQYRKASVHNPVVHFVLKLTRAPLKYPQLVLHSFKGINTAALLLILLLTLLKLFILFLMSTGGAPNFLGLTVWSLGSIFDQVLDLYFFAILAYVIFTWIAQLQQSPVMEVLATITYPLISRARRVIPLLGGVDLSPILLVF